MKQGKSYKIINGHLKGHILSTSGCCQTKKDYIYGYVGWTPYELLKEILEEIL